jgi:RNA polymerase sigma-70 factor (ECF subfamily)
MKAAAGASHPSTQKRTKGSPEMPEPFLRAWGLGAMTEYAVENVSDLAEAPVEPVSLPFAGPVAIATFEEVYRAHFRDLSGYCAALLNDDQLGVDCAQEAFTRLFGRFRSVNSPRAWLFLVATNIVRDEWRNRARHRDTVVALATSSRHSVDAVDGALLDAVRRLPAAHAEVVLLHYFADLPLEEVARQIRRPLGTVKRRLHEARARLQRAIEADR